MYLNSTVIENSMRELQTTHPFLGITFIVCKQGRLPVGEAVEFAINREEDEFLKQHYQPDPRSKWFYRPFRVSNRSQDWLRPGYASKGSQKTRTSTFSNAFIHEKGTNLWGWQEQYVRSIKAVIPANRLASAFALAVWLFREQDLPKETTPQDLLAQFFKQFGIDETEKSELFKSVSVPDYVRQSHKARNKGSL